MATIAGLEVKIRTPSVNDAGEILSMIDGDFYTYIGGSDSAGDSGTLLAVTPIDLWKRINNGNIFCAYSGEEIVGTASLVEYGNGRRDTGAELATLYVKQGYRGAGISTMLKDKVVERAIEQGYGLLYSYTNQNALPTFLNWGFVTTTSTPVKLANFCSACPKYEVNCNEIPVVLKTGYMPKAE